VHFEFLRRKTGIGWQATCNYHPKAPSSRVGAGGLPLKCTRECSGEDALRTLKQWCLDGVVTDNRGDHMNPLLFPHAAGGELPTEAALNDKLEELRQDPAHND
jgi:hypothetical protein